ncbi:hypothetical protein [Brevundimonas sp.]|uniref:hypothetical protein n=1 Tax=Brevundimonas sp. TaxID=1871086 RepID=UPI002899F001|nr:hypothetical protein [Brevundimonas sp.]
MKYVVALGAVALVLSGCASGGTTAHFRTGVASDAYLADVAACQEVAQQAANNVAHVNSYNPALSSQVGAAIGAGFAEGLAKGKAMNEGFEGCMAARNYRQVELNEAERSQFRALRNVDDRKAWLSNFAAQDHDSRAIPPQPPKECKPNALVTCTS